MDTAVLSGLNRIRDLDQLASGGIGVDIGASFCEFHLLYVPHIGSGVYSQSAVSATSNNIIHCATGVVRTLNCRLASFGPIPLTCSPPEAQHRYLDHASERRPLLAFRKPMI